MQQAFWLERWQLNQIGFHNQQINPHLEQNWPLLNQAAGSLTFVPLCGKSKDMLWLLAQGHQVVAVELSSLAVEAFFSENGLSAKTFRQGKFEVFEMEGLRIYCGDFFDLTAADLSGVKSVYDRASLVALPPEMREEYSARMQKLLPTGTQTLLVAFDYPQHEMPGPPFSVQETEVRKLYQSWCEVQPLYSEDILNREAHFRDRGLSQMREEIYALTVK